MAVNEDDLRKASDDIDEQIEVFSDYIDSLHQLKLFMTQDILTKGKYSEEKDIEYFECLKTLASKGNKCGDWLHATLVPVHFKLNQLDWNITQKKKKHRGNQ